jgi:hypothetical protein
MDPAASPWMPELRSPGDFHTRTCCVQGENTAQELFSSRSNAWTDVSTFFVHYVTLLVMRLLRHLSVEAVKAAWDEFNLLCSWVCSASSTDPSTRLSCIELLWSAGRATLHSHQLAVMIKKGQ